MSTAIAEPPPEVKSEVIVPPAQDPAAIVDSLLKPKVTPGVTERVELKATEKVPDKAAEKVPEKTEKAAPDQDKNWAEMRAAREADKQAREAAEAELKKVREEYEGYKAKPVPKEFEEKLTAAEKRALELDVQLKTVALARHPDFQRKYQAPIELAMKNMVEVAQAAGIDKAEAHKAVEQWNEAAFAEWVGNMAPQHEVKFKGIWSRAIELDSARAAELADADNAWKEIEKRQQDEAKGYQDKFQSALREDKKGILAELLEKQEIFKGDEALRKETEALIDKAAGLGGEKMTNREVLNMIAQGHVLARHFQRVDAERTEHAAKIEELSKKVAEQDEFIKSLNGGSLVPGPAGAKKGAVDDKFIDSLIRPSVRG